MKGDSMTTSPLAASNEDRVRLIAHTLWVEEGMPEGRADIHWFKALELVDAEAAEAKILPVEAAAKPRATRKAPATAARKPAPRKRG